MGKASKLPGSQQSQRIKEFRVQSSAWGAVRPLVYGEARVAGNIVDAWDFHAKQVTSGLGAFSSGKAGGGPNAFKQFHYDICIVLALGEGGPSIAALLWAGVTDAFDVGLATPGEQAVSVGTGGNKNLQPTTGIEPGAWKAKRVLVLGTKDKTTAGYKWNHAAWRPFDTTQRFIALSTDVPTDALDGTAKSHYTSEFGETHKGLAYAVAEALGLGSNATIPNWNMPARILCATGDVYGGGFVKNDSGVPGIRDADPAVIWLDILANPKHGIGWWDGFDATLPGAGRLAAALPDWPHPWGAGCTGSTTPTIAARADSWSAFCRANDILISPVFDTQQAAADVLKQLAEETQTAVVCSEGLVKMIPYSDVAITSARTGITYTPTNDPTSTTTGANIAPRYVLTLDDFLPGENKDPVQIERKSVNPDHGSAGLFNDIHIEFQHRLNGYSTEIAPSKDEASINAVGLLSAPTFTYHEITDPNLAADTAERHLQRLVSVRNVYRFSLGWRFGRLEPMDVLSLPGEALSPALTGQSIIVRLTSRNEDKTGKLDFEAEDFPHVFKARAPEPITTPTTTPADGPSLVMNGAYSLNNIQLASPVYVDPTGMVSSATEVSPEPATPLVLPAYCVLEDDVTVVGFAARMTRRIPPDPSHSPPVVAGVARLRLFVDGASQPDLELTFAWSEQNVTKFAEGAVDIPGGTPWCLEITYVDALGNPFPPTDTGSVQFAEQAFNWQLVMEA